MKNKVEIMFCFIIFFLSFSLLFLMKYKEYSMNISDSLSMPRYNVRAMIERTDKAIRHSCKDPIPDDYVTLFSLTDSIKRVKRAGAIDFLIKYYNRSSACRIYNESEEPPVLSVYKKLILIEKKWLEAETKEIRLEAYNELLSLLEKVKEYEENHTSFVPGIVL